MPRNKGNTALIVIAAVLVVLIVAIWFEGDWLVRELKAMHGGHR